MQFLQEQFTIQEAREEVRTHNKKPFSTENQFKPTPSMSQTFCHASNSNKQDDALKQEDTIKRNCAICNQDHSTFTLTYKS